MSHRITPAGPEKKWCAHLMISRARDHKKGAGSSRKPTPHLNSPLKNGDSLANETNEKGVQEVVLSCISPMVRGRRPVWKGPETIQEHLTLPAVAQNIAIKSFKPLDVPAPQIFRMSRPRLCPDTWTSRRLKMFSCPRRWMRPMPPVS